MTQFCYFEITLRGSLLIFKFQLDWTYCFADMAVVRFCHFGWKMPIRAYFWRWGHSKKKFPALRAVICAPTVEKLPTPLMLPYLVRCLTDRFHCGPRPVDVDLTTHGSTSSVGRLNVCCGHLSALHVVPDHAQTLQAHSHQARLRPSRDVHRRTSTRLIWPSTEINE